MRRVIYAVLMIGLLLPSLLLAQDPIATEEPVDPNSLSGLPSVEVPAEGETVDPAAIAQPTSPIEAEALPILINARTDLELLATQTLGGDRPIGWSGSIDVNNPQLPLLMRLDLELLAGTLLGIDQRPAGWFGAVGSTQIAVSRDIRHDLELLADTVIQPNVRPPGWAGGDPLMRCDRAVQALVNLLERGGSFQIQVDLNDPNFCQLAEVQASRFAEQGQVNAVSANTSGGAQAVAPGSIQITTNFAVAFLDRNARQPVGTVPQGTVIQPVARSYAQFSRMMLIRGDGFEAFIQYDSSSIDEAAYRALPDVNTTGFSPSCIASWCTGGAG